LENSFPFLQKVTTDTL